ncbi:receptor-like protein EIX2 [Cryptomeria japonica]|uniref:receptor-like protein EIX2 n=1 Tax=Cryptomeria japonica TaxID=3369 RepID=UPI0027DA049B|nr:receptor-like protein EIX2 [Cryptomeria japonica]
MEATFSSGRVAFAIITILCCFTSPAIACPFPERNLLLDFKAAVVDEYNTLTSWQGFNCCTWRGVGCNLRTGHVSGLYLSGYKLKGNNTSSLFQLAQLEHLDLSDNLFKGKFSPPHNRKLKSLTFLDLSFAGYVNETSLGSVREFYVSLESVSNLVSLEYLSLAAVNISASKEWGEAVGSLSNLQKLHMSDCGLGGPIPNSLLNLTSLLHLDLSENYLSAQIPAWFENMTAHLLSLDLSWNNNLGGDISFIRQRKSSLSLTNIDLSGTAMEGRIPSAVGNISCLEYLRLRESRIEGEIPAATGNLLFLQILDLSDTRIEGEIPSATGNLSFLQILDLSDTRIEGEIPAAIGSVSSLKSLDLSNTRIEGEIPAAIGNVSSLKSLRLFSTSIEGEIPLSIVNLSKLVSLELSYNKLTGVIPPSLDSLSSLVSLHLYANELNGTIPSTISNLVNLRSLWLDSNSLSGLISLSVFDNLTRLNDLYLSYNHLTVNIDSTWIPQFKLSYLGLGSCNLDRIPSFLVTQYDLEYLNLSANSIPTNIPSWIWNLPSLYSLNLSCNQLTGSLPSRLTLPKYSNYVDLHNNSLQGALPLPPAGAYLLDLSMNQFNGSIPTDIGAYLQNTEFLSLSRNNLSEAIPDSICTSDLQVLDLSNNTLSSVIPPHLTRNCSFLSVLDLAENHLEGKMPVEWGNISKIHTLKLNGNHLRGVIPSPISKGRSLQVLDLGNNDLEGTVPHWIGKLSQLRVLVLRSNHFHGSIPRQVIGLPNLQILDLSGNHLSGAFPSNLTNLLAMVNASQNNSNHLEGYSSTGATYANQITISWKGCDVEFVKVLFILKCIDLSNNNLSGSIPPEMGSLQGLIALNLSRNHLSG